MIAHVFLQWSIFDSRTTNNVLLQQPQSFDIDLSIRLSFQTLASVIFMLRLTVFRRRMYA